MTKQINNNDYGLTNPDHTFAFTDGKKTFWYRKGATTPTSPPGPNNPAVTLRTYPHPYQDDLPSPSEIRRYNKTLRNLHHLRTWREAIDRRLPWTGGIRHPRGIGRPSEAIEMLLTLRRDIADTLIRLDQLYTILETEEPLTLSEEPSTLFERMDHVIRELKVKWPILKDTAASILPGILGPPSKRTSLDVALDKAAQALGPERAKELRAEAEQILKDAQKASLASRRYEWIHRITTEMHQLTSGDSPWYVVFDTLTVDDRYLNIIFPPDGLDKTAHTKAWEDYITTIRDNIRSQMLRKGYEGTNNGKGLSSIPTHEDHRYVAVIEYGKKKQRPHIHIVHLCRELPAESRDPNAGRKIPYLREINAFKKYWQYGFSCPIAGRFDRWDAYSRLGWEWPSTKQGKPLPQTKPLMLGYYLSKYMSKDFDDMIGEGNYQWRIKASRQFGSRIYREMMEEMPTHLIDNILMDPHLIHAVCQRISMLTPYGYQRPIRQAAIHQWVQNQIRTQTQMNSLYSTYKELKPRQSLYANITKTVSQITGETSSDTVNIGSLLTESTTSMVTSDRSEETMFYIDETVKHMVKFLQSQLGEQHIKEVSYKC